MIDGLLKLMNTENINNPINLGSDIEMSVLSIAKLIKIELSSESNIIFKDLPKDDPLLRCPNIDRAKNLLKWKPEVTLNVGIKKSLNWYKDNLVIN